MRWLTRDNIKAVRALHTARTTQNLAVFIGAGTTVEANGPTWKALVTKLLSAAAEKIGAQLPTDSTTEEKWLSHFQTTCCGDLLEAAQIANDVLQERFSRTVDAVVSKTLEGTALIPHATPRAIAHLYPDVTEVFTTNFDTLLETAFRVERFRDSGEMAVLDKVAVFASDKDIHTIEVTTPSFRIHKLHGKAGSDSIYRVLTDEQYARSLRNLTAQRASWIAALATKTILFVGSSMTDIAWRFLRAQMLETAAGLVRDVYAIVPKPALPKGSEGTGRAEYQRLAQTLLSLHWNRMGIHPVWIEDYADVPEIVEEIASNNVEDDFAVRKGTQLVARLGEVRRDVAEYSRFQKALDWFVSNIRDKVPSIDSGGISINLMAYDAGEGKLRIAAASSGYPAPGHVIWDLCLGVRDCDQITDNVPGPQGVSGAAFRSAGIKTSISNDRVDDRLPKSERAKVQEHLIQTLVSIPVREPGGVRRLGVVNIDLPAVNKELVRYAESSEGGRYLVESAQSVVKKLLVSLGV